tara:strand:+ start:145 stop:873 length:729 start_codon:yes stop_codon:yes gene_type:complete
MEIVAFFIGHWYLSLFTQTFFHHRYSAHQMFKMNKFWEKVFFVLSLIFQGSSYLSPYAYGILHRLHHAYADGFRDPHSPSNDKNIFRMMWKTKIIYSKIRKNQYSIKDKYLINLPEWHSFDVIATSWPIRLLTGFGYFYFYYVFVPEGQWFWYALLPVHFIMGPIHGAIINWFAHTIGYRNFESKDTSRNFMPWDLIMLGEGLHNNHHARPKANFAVKWHEFDPVYPIIYCLNKLNIIRLNK